MNLQSDNIYVVLFSFWLTIGGGEIRQVQRWDDAEEAEEEVEMKHFFTEANECDLPWSGKKRKSCFCLCNIGTIISLRCLFLTFEIFLAKGLVEHRYET